MPFYNEVVSKGMIVVGYSCHDPQDWELLQKKLTQLNSLEDECQADEELSGEESCYTKIDDFLLRPALYNKCVVATVEHPGDLETRRIEAVACFAVKPMFLNGRNINAAFGFLSRTRPSFRKKGAFKMFFSLLPMTFAKVRVCVCVC
jgi:hypothetical protein